MQANATLGKAKINTSSDNLFWLDPWSADGRAAGAKVLPLAKELRLHAEKAIVLLEQVRMANPKLREPEALDAMDLGARRLDLIGMKWELCQEIADDYAKAMALEGDPNQRSEMHTLLYEISSNNGHLQDLRDAYSATKNEFKQVWLSENRPYWLDNVLVRYDLEIQKWQQRGWEFSAAQHAMGQPKGLPAPQELGLPAAN
jgi:hexosaminidase